MAELAPKTSGIRYAALLSVVAVLAFAGGAFIIAREVSTLAGTVLVTGVWFVVVAAALWLVTRGRRQARRLSLLVLFGVAAIMGVAGAMASLGDKVVDEDVARAGSGNTEVASGSFEGVAHHSRGTATVIQTGDGERVLTLTDFDNSPGPDLRLYLVAGNPSTEGDVKDYEDLGALKGNKGDQQYDLKDIDTTRYNTVVVWCRAFTVLFSRAPLTAAS